MTKEQLCWGIDLGGTKIECTVLRQLPDRFEVVARERIPTEAHLGYQQILSQVARLIKSISKELSTAPVTVGIGHPGVISPSTQLLKNSNTQCLNGMPLQQDLERVLGYPVTCANDANCFALAEALYGAGKGFETVFGVILGTGVGGGIVVNGQIIGGRQGIAGEWGHNLLIPDGAPCYCSKRGCVETVISGPALERFYSQHAGKSASLERITHAAVSGDPAAERTITHLTKYFGEAIAAVINILDPQCIVLGGGVSNIDRLYTDGVSEAKKHIFNSEPDIIITKHQLGDSAGVIGAALLAVPEFLSARTRLLQGL